MSTFLGRLLNHSLFAHWSTFFSKIIVCLGAIVVLFGMYQYYYFTNLTEKGDATTICQTNKSSDFITVDVSGAVSNPGVYTFESGVRKEQAIKAAGEFTNEADTEYISKQLNLAETLTDGEKIFVPKIGEFQIVSNEITNLKSNQISLNNSSKEELTQLVGIGEKRAEDIINGRPYGSLLSFKEAGIIPISVFNENASNIGL